MSVLPVAAARPPASSSILGRLVLAVLLANLLVFALAALSLSQSQRQYQERAEITTRNLAQVLESHLGGIIDKIDIVLLATVDESEKQIAGGIDAKALNSFLARQQARLPELDSLRVADARGLVSFGTGIPQGRKVDISDRRHFIRLRDDARAGLVIAEPIFARINRKWVLPLARRINHPDGSFAGMAYAFIPLEYFYHSFSALNVGPRGIVTLRDAELGILVRHPEPKGIGSVIGQKAAPPPLREMVGTGRKAGTYLSLSTVDGIERTFSYRRVGNYPFLIIVGLASDDYFTEWRNDAAKLLALAAFFSLATLLGAGLIYRAWMHRTLATEALRELNETLEQRVDEAVRKNMEQERLLIQQSRLAALGEMIGNIAHQWRQPLNALGLLQANIQDAFEFGELNREIMQRFTETGQRLIQKMSTTIDDFRDFFKPHREKSEFSLEPAIARTLNIVSAGFHNHDIAIVHDTGADIRVVGFPNEFSQVLLNVLNNAKDAILESKIEGGRIAISLGQDDQSAWIIIGDNGGGIPPPSLPKIFDPYFTTKDKGTGIGLYMSRMIMEHMDGTIEARNLGDGAEFRMILPKAALSRPA